MRSTWILGFVCLLPAVAHASPEADQPPEQKHELLERRLFLPGLLGFGADTTLLALGPGTVGISTGSIGVLAYGGGDMSAGGSKSHIDSFSFNPSFDVRVGRFTVGGGMSVACTRSTMDGSESEATSFLFAPRVGYLAPIGKELYLWPRASLGLLVGQESATGYETSALTGFVASADLLLVVGLGQHFFLTMGPSGSYQTASTTGGTSSTFGVGASVGIGVAL